MESKVVFFTDDWLKNQRANQVRLVKGNSGIGSNIIIKGFVNSESFNIGIENDFKQLDGLAGIGKVNDQITNLRKKANMVGAVGSGITSGMSAIAKKYFSKDGKTNVVTEVFDAISNATKEANGFMQKYTQLDFDTADAYLYMFGGTSVSVPTRFTQYLVTDSKSRDIESKLTKIIDYLMGDYKTDAAGFVGITSPPNGFKTSLDGLKGIAPEGTFTMYYGEYRFPGVVVTGIDIDVSRTRVNCGSKKSPKYRPLYIQIEYSVKPVIKYTKNHVLSWLSGNKSKQVNNG